LVGGVRVIAGVGPECGPVGGSLGGTLSRGSRVDPGVGGLQGWPVVPGEWGPGRTHCWVSETAHAVSFWHRFPKCPAVGRVWVGLVCVV